MPLKPKSLLFNGKYRVVRLLGAGRFGTVYLAREEKYAVDRAVKLLSTADEGVGTTVYDDLRMRYRLEYQLGTKLDHPNVVRALTVEEDGETIGLVMEYAAGGSLAQRLKTEGRLGIDESLGLLGDCARGLRALHALDAVHRDLKPSNILLTGDGRAKIGDLGLAQVPGGPSARTMLGDAALPHPGTPEYMSPEHRHPDSLSPTSDVYGLGCVAWEMLTGTVWRNRKHKVGSLKDLRPESPDWLDALLRRMLADVPGLRPQDAADEDKRFVDMEGVLVALAGAGSGPARKPEPAVDTRPSLGRAVDLIDAEAFAEAIAMLEALLAGGAAPRTVEAILTDAREAQALEQRRRGIRQEYEAITILARSKRTEHRALEAWERFCAEYPDWDEDPAELAAWADAHPLTAARRKAEAEAEARRKAEAEAEARKKAEAEAEARRKAEAEAVARRKAEAEAEARRKTEAARLAAERAAAARHAVPTATPDQKRLVTLIRDPKVPAAERAEAGRKLAELGDPRPGVGLRPDGLPDIVWVDIPAGAFIMGSDDHYNAEKPKRSVTLGSFAIGMFPVTYAQYKAFLEAKDGYANPKWWSEPIKLAVRDDQPGDQYQKIANHPAERVSWYDAVAFTRWLTARLRAAGELKAGTEIRLPTEEEWERAARGTDGRMYPWGDVFKDGHANLIDGPAGQRLTELARAEKARSGNWEDYGAEFWKDTTPGIKRTTAVGCYPQGEAPSGVLDAAGNVWEWTLTEYTSKVSADITNDRPRVVRGGSWNRYPDSARASYRGSNTPARRGYDIGFRVVVAAPVS